MIICKQSSRNDKNTFIVTWLDDLRRFKRKDFKCLILDDNGEGL